MKRMSEVFELPLVSMPEADDQLQDANEDWALVVRLPWRADYAAHAINHVDALADALGDIVFDYFATINLSNVDIATLNPELHKKMTVATDALAAYRGDK